MSRRLAVVARDSKPLPRNRSCREWREHDRAQRDLTLAGLMQWSWFFYRVELKLLRRGEHVGVCELKAFRPGEGKARKVMGELCTWADCAAIALELTPSGQWGADIERLTAFYASLGFMANEELAQPYRVQGTMIRYWVADSGHERCRTRQSDQQ